MIRATGLIVILSAALGALVHFSYPAAAAAACPSCYGFVDVGDDVFVERAVAADRRIEIRKTIDAARDRVRAFYSDMQSRPRVLICATDECYRPLGGGSRGVTLLDKTLILSPRGTDTVIAAHELAHAERHHRIGLFATLRHSVPQWFDEGLAVVVSDDPRYLKPGADRCLAQPDGTLPTSRGAWIETAEHAELYAKAACKVSRWLAAHGGAKSLVRALADEAYRDVGSDG